MRGIITIIKRNMKILSRSKLSTILILLVPVLIVFILGSAFSSTSLSNLNLGVYSPQYSELSNSLVVSLNDEQFNAYKVGSEQECINRVELGETHGCIVFPANFSIKDTNSSIIIHVDNSRLDVAYLLVNNINSKIETKASELGVAMADSLLDVLQETKDSLPSQKEKINSVSSDMEEIKSLKSLSDYSDLDTAVEDIDGAITILNEINSSESNEVKEDLEEVKENIEQFKSENSEDTEGILENAETGYSELVKIESELESIIQKLSSIDIESSENIVDPIDTEVNSISKGSTNWKHLFPKLISLIILLSGIVLASIIVLNDKKAKASFRNVMTPTSDFSFVAGTYLTCLILLLIQIAILFAGTIYLTGLDLVQFLQPLALVLFLASSVFIFLGMFVGYIFRSDETIILSSISIAALFIFFSNIIIPIETISGYFRYVALYNPLFITTSLLKKIILFNETLSSFYLEIAVLVGSFVLLFAFTLTARKVIKRFI